MIREYLLTTDKFQRPSAVSGVDAVGLLLIRLLILEPGTNPLHPDMGVGIGTKYRFITTDQLMNLESRIMNQITTYMPPNYQNAEIHLSINVNKALVISIVIQGVSYIYDTSDSDTPVTLTDVLEQQ